MGSNLAKIKSIIADNSLTREDQEELLSIFVKASENELAPIRELLEADASWVGKLNTNYKVKKAVLNTGDAESWRTLLKEEAKEVDKI